MPRGPQPSSWILGHLTLSITQPGPATHAPESQWLAVNAVCFVVTDSPASCDRDAGGSDAATSEGTLGVTRNCSKEGASLGAIGGSVAL